MATSRYLRACTRLMVLSAAIWFSAPSALRSEEPVAPTVSTSFVLNHNAPVVGVAISPDGLKAVTATSYKQAAEWRADIYLWDLRTGIRAAVIGTVTGSAPFEPRVAISNDGSRLAVNGKDEIVTGKLRDLTETKRVPLPGATQAVALLDDGATLVCGYQKCFVAKSDPEEFSETRLMGVYIYSLAASPQGDVCAVAGDRDGFFGVMNNRGVQWFSDRREDIVLAHAWSPDGGKLAALYLSDSIEVLDTKKREVVRTLKLARPHGIRALAFVDNDWLVTGERRFLQMRNVDNGKPAARNEVKGIDRVESIVVSSDGKVLLASGSTSTAVIMLNVERKGSK